MPEINMYAPKRDGWNLSNGVFLLLMLICSAALVGLVIAWGLAPMFGVKAVVVALLISVFGGLILSFFSRLLLKQNSPSLTKFVLVTNIVTTIGIGIWFAQVRYDAAHAEDHPKTPDYSRLKEPETTPTPSLKSDDSPAPSTLTAARGSYHANESTDASTASVRTSTEGWPVPYLIDGEWNRASPASVRILKQNVENQSPASSYSVNKVTEFRCRKLPFYPGAQLCEGLLQDNSGVVDLINMRNGNTYVLNGTAAPIHKINASEGITLDSDNEAADYLSFFAAGVYSDDGNFRILQDPQDLRWQDQPSSDELQRARSIIRATLMKRKEDNNWTTNATVQYGQNLWNVDFTVESTGNVKMDNDNPVFQSTRLARDKFSGPVRSAY